MCPLYCRQQKEESESADQSLLDERATVSSLWDNTSVATYVWGTYTRQRILLKLQPHCTGNTQNKLLVAVQMLL